MLVWPDSCTARSPSPLSSFCLSGVSACLLQYTSRGAQLYKQMLEKESQKLTAAAAYG